MARFCSNCGTAVGDDVRFCPSCGAPVTAAQQPYAQPAQTAGNGEVREGIPAPGWSDRVHHPEILAAMKKNRNAAKVFLFCLIPVPIIGFGIYGLVSEKAELRQALINGAIVSAIFLIFALVSFFREREANEYEAVVIDKKSRDVYQSKGDRRELVRQYKTIVQTTAGKTKTITEYEDSQVWAFSYFDVGDRFRYHPQFHFPYEHYDKSKAPYLVCVSCGTSNPVEADRCRRCNLPLLK